MPGILLITGCGQLVNFCQVISNLMAREAARVYSEPAPIALAAANGSIHSTERPAWIGGFAYLPRVLAPAF
jgi:hypothetical protein